MSLFISPSNISSRADQESEMGCGAQCEITWQHCSSWNTAAFRSYNRLLSSLFIFVVYNIAQKHFCEKKSLHFWTVYRCIELHWISNVMWNVVGMIHYTLLIYDLFMFSFFYIIFKYTNPNHRLNYWHCSPVAHPDSVCWHLSGAPSPPPPPPPPPGSQGPSCPRQSRHFSPGWLPPSELDWRERTGGYAGQMLEVEVVSPLVGVMR